MQEPDRRQLHYSKKIYQSTWVQSVLQRPWIVKSESTEESPVRTTVEVVREYKQKSADFCRADVYVYWAFNQYNCPLSYINKFLLLLRLPMGVSEDLPPRCYIFKRVQQLGSSSNLKKQ